VRQRFPRAADDRLRCGSFARIEPYREQIRKDLAETGAVSVVWQRLRDEAGLDVSLSTFRRYVQVALGGTVSPADVVIWRPEVPPGEEALFRWFCHIGVRDPVPDDTTLVRFRARLREEGFSEILDEIVRQAKEKGLLKERIKLVDSTKVCAEVAAQNTYGLLRQGRRCIMRALKKCDPARAQELSSFDPEREERPQAEQTYQERLQREMEVAKELLSRPGGGGARAGEGGGRALPGGYRGPGRDRQLPRHRRPLGPHRPGQALLRVQGARFLR